MNKKNSIKEWVYKESIKLKNFCYTHEDELKVAVPIIIGAGNFIVKVGNKAYRKANDIRKQRIKDTRYYDRSQNMYVKLKRVRTQDDWNEIHRRQKNGEKMGDILKTMDLVK